MRVARTAIAGAVAVVLAAGIVHSSAPPAARAQAAEPVSDLRAQVQATPTRAGTERDPRPVSMTGVLRWRQATDARPPSHVNLYFSRRLAYSAAGRPACRPASSTYAAVAACPPGSIVGSATAGGEPTINPFCTSHVLLANGGGRRLLVAARGGCGLSVDEVAATRVVALGSGRWGQRIALPLTEVLTHSASSPNGAFMLFRLGERFRGPSALAPERPRPSGYWTTTGCPAGGRHALRAEIPYAGADPAAGATAARATARCSSAPAPRRRGQRAR